MAMLTSSKGGALGEYLRRLLSAQPYKHGQGALARNGSLAAAGLMILAGMYAWMQSRLDGQEALLQWGAPIVFGALAGWVAYRTVHYPRFADFLITTEAEMKKVSWPNRAELKASTIVVLVNVVLLAIFLFVADLFWRFLLQALGILKISGFLGGGSGL